ncbi:MAG: SRPBCC family protein [Actinomycetes bacterium]
MGTVAHYLEVNAPAEQCYAWWRGLTNLPQIMSDVESVEPLGGSTEVTRWKVSGPLGKTVEWDARIVEDVPGSKIAWATVDSSGTEVRNSGAVRFDDHGGTTGVEVSLAYDPPAGPLGEAVATLFSDPQAKVEEALQAFKQTIEGATPGPGGPTVKQH